MSILALRNQSSLDKLLKQVQKDETPSGGGEKKVKNFLGYEYLIMHSKAQQGNGLLKTL